MKILDATCGMRAMWYQKKHPFVTYMDKRKCCTEDTPNTKIAYRRNYKVNPDVIADWTKKLPFPDGHFDMIMFDPPHIIRPKNYSSSGFTLRFGYLPSETWKQDLKKGFKELFRVLKPMGFFVLKWNECNKKVEEVLKLAPYKPICGTRTGQGNKTHWILFLKYRPEKKLEVL